MGISATVLGASGFAGAELLRLLGNHPEVEVIAAGASSRAGLAVTDVFPSLRGYENMVYGPIEEVLEVQADVVFASLPHTHSMGLFTDAPGRVVDLGADFRLSDASVYEQWFGIPHVAPESLSRWVYGLPESHRAAIRTSQLTANPGCYPTAVLLALLPIKSSSLRSGETVHVDAVSGVSGAGRAGGEGFDFMSAADNVRPYKVTGHSHIPEMEEQLGAIVSFVPTLVPMGRGILATCRVHAGDSVTQDDLDGMYEARFKHEPFVKFLVDTLPETKRLVGSNFAEVAVRLDARTNTVIAMCTLDNLGKGAAGQAVQNFNLMFGLDEAAGLSEGGLPV
ncbi:MAG: N-acetyl-gamma-glutamyl-phosphate reductase [Actinomycetota bacterium]